MNQKKRQIWLICFNQFNYGSSGGQKRGRPFRTGKANKADEMTNSITALTMLDHTRLYRVGISALGEYSYTTDVKASV